MLSYFRDPSLSLLAQQFHVSFLRLRLRHAEELLIYGLRSTHHRHNPSFIRKVNLTLMHTP